MRAGLSTIQQTLTPEAASVLNQSIADARRRGHSQTTPLHVAAILLSSPNGFFRQACVQSHPNPSHPLQSRALELCFSVALERVPSSGSAVVAGVAEPPVSNALMAALKRAQAHQRRGCPEQQQQPLLAVKVELEQLVISILDDPSVSRVMREAGFSSPTVKCTIEKTMNNSPNPAVTPGAAVFSLRPVPPTNLYMNPRLQRLTGQRVEEVKSSYTNPRLQEATDRPAGGQRTDEVKNSYMNPRLQDTAHPPDRVKRVDEGKNLFVNPRLQSSPNGGHRAEDVEKVVNVLQRSEKGNPVLVGDHEPEAVMLEFLQKIESKELGEKLKNVGVISVEKELASLCVGNGEEKGGIRVKIKELGVLIESRMGNQDGVILNLGDFRWLVERPDGGFGVSGSGTVQEVVAEVAKLLLREEKKKVWLMGTATCETYLRCQVYHPTLEDDWHLHAVPIAARSPLPGLFTRLGGKLGSSAESIAPLKTSQLPNLLLPSGRLTETGNPPLAGKMSCCTSCMESYETERARVASDEAEKPSSESKPQEAQLPQWLRLAKAVSDSSLSKQNSQQLSRQKAEELQKKWNETCSRLHRGYNAIVINDKPSSPAASSPLFNSLLSGNILRPNQRQLGRTNILQPSNNATLNLLQEPAAKVTSPVRTELALGRPRSSSPDDVANDQLQESVATPDVDRYNPKLFVDLDADSFKRLFKGLTHKVAWQTDAATTVASVVTKCRSDDGKRKGAGARGDMWLLFVGPDRVGKKKMAEGLSELVFGNKPIYVRLGSGEGADEDSGPRLWGKTVLDRISDAVRRNPFSVIVLEDVDQADSLTHINLNRAMERGRLPDSHGRELKLGNVIFILTAGLMPEKFPSQKQASGRFKEDRLAAASACFHPLQLKIGSRNKRRPAWLEEAEESNRKRALTIDLNQSVDDVDLSRDSSDITVETALKLPTPTTAMTELAERVDKAIAFKVVDFEALSKRIMRALDGKFSVHVCKAAFEIEEEALEQLLAGIWFGQGHGGFDELERWADRVLVPVFRELESGFELKENTVIRLAVIDGETGTANWLPGDVPVTRG